MSERERWIVYPLLFLALGAALRDKLFDMTTSKRIVCQELTVIDEEPVGLRPARVLARIGRNDGLPSTTPPMGLLFVDGQVEVNGAVVARQVAVRGLPYAPGIFSIVPHEIWQAIQQYTQSLPNQNSQNSGRENVQPSQDTSGENKVPAKDGTSSADEPPQ